MRAYSSNLEYNHDDLVGLVATCVQVYWKTMHCWYSSKNELFQYAELLVLISRDLLFHFVFQVTLFLKLFVLFLVHSI